MGLNFSLPGGRFRSNFRLMDDASHLTECPCPLPRPCGRKLSDLPCGDCGVVASVCLDGGPTGQRLMALGLRPGCHLKFLKNAPFGDPMMIETSVGVICLRRREAALIELEPAA